MRSLLLLFLSIGLAALPGPAARAAARAPAQATHGMVVTGQADAARAGQAMLARGGNAVDAAIASSFALGVSDPYHSGIGGGAFLLIRLASGEVVAVDARETAPAAADRDMYVREGVAEHASRWGALAVGVPGLVAGAALALEQYGTLPLAEVLEPAIRLAEEGFDAFVWTDAPGADYAAHHHDHDESLWLVRGGITFGTQGAEHPLGPGDRLMLPRGTVHTARVGPAGATYWIGRR